MKHHLLLLAVALFTVCLSASASLAAVWSTPEVIGLEDTYPDFDPEIAIDPQGRVWVVWMGVDEGSIHDFEIYWSRWEEGSGWLPRQRVNPDNTLYDAWPRFSMAPDGTAWAVWLRRQSGGYYWDFVSSRWDGTAWTPPELAVSGPYVSDGNYHGLAAVDSTHCWIVYDQGYRVYAKEYLGDHWGPIETVAPTSADRCWMVDAALSPGGQPWAAWTQAGIRASKRQPDGTWQTPVLVDPPGSDGLNPSIAVDASGEAWVTWGDNSYWCPPNDYGDAFCCRTIGGVWQSFTVVNDHEDSDCGEDSYPDVDCAYGFPPRVSWSRLHPGNLVIRYREPFATSWDSQMWSPQCQITQPEYYPNAKEDVSVMTATGPQGQAWVTWMRGGTVNGSYDVYASRLLLDIIDFDVHRGALGVEISWRVVGYAPRSDYLFSVLRTDDAGDTTQIGEAFFGSGDEYLVMDESAAPGQSFSYRVDVMEPIEGLDPPTGTLLFSTNWRAIAPLVISVREPGWRDHVPFTASPNPSSNAVEFRFGMAAPGCVLEVFDVQGRLVWRHEAPAAGAAGWRSVRWTPHAGGSNASGVFWARLRSKDGSTLGSTKVVVLQ